MIKKRMKRNKARDMAIYLSRNYSGITCKELVEVISSLFLKVWKSSCLGHGSHHSNNYFTGSSRSQAEPGNGKIFFLLLDRAKMA